MALSFAAAPHPVGLLNAYWGQSGQSLRRYCDSGIDTVTLSFLTRSPEQEKSGYPATNFANHCGWQTYTNSKGVSSNLLSNCQSIKEDIPYCKKKGVKILLSVGGQVANVKVTTTKKAEEFSDFLYKAFGPYDKNWKGPRPFDLSATSHTSVDGFDFDIEQKIDNKPYITIVERLRKHNPKQMITIAPQCPIGNQYAFLTELIMKAQFDRFFIQFYNNPGCDAFHLPKEGPAEAFNYDKWEALIAKSAKSKNAKLFIGLTALKLKQADGGGYISPQGMKNLICKFKDRKHFGGVSIWDLGLADKNIIDGKKYWQHALDGLKSCPKKKRDEIDGPPSYNQTITTSHGGPISTDATIPTSVGRWNGTSTVVLTTSTVITTSIYTVTKCPAYVTNCPEGGYVTTETIPLYTTVCPVTEIHGGNPPPFTRTIELPPTHPTSVAVSPVCPDGPSCRNTIETQTRSVTQSGGCSGFGCPNNVLSNTPGLPQVTTVSAKSPAGTVPAHSSTPTLPVLGGASTLIVGLAGLIAMVALQIVL